MTEKTYIKKIANYAIKNYNNHKILPSLTIAQAILESGHFKSELTKYNNFYGMKWTTNCGCAFVSLPTKEYINGKYITVNAKFRQYNNINEGIKGYYNFLNYARYQNLKGVTDYKKACELIQKDGWATSPTYSNALKSIIESYNLTNYDNKIIKNNATDLYYSVPKYKTESIVNALNMIKIDSSFEYRAKIAKVNNITNYKGSYDQNIKMLSLLYKGKLKKVVD